MSASAWSISEHRGLTGLEALRADWDRLYADMPARTVFHAYAAFRAYAEHLMESPERLRCLALSDGRRVRAVGAFEARVDRTLGFPVPVWSLPFHPHWPLADVVCPEDDARRAFLPAAVRHLRGDPLGRNVMVVGPLAATSVLWEGLRDLDRRDACLDDAEAVHVIDTTEPLEVRLALLNRKFRHLLRSRGRRLDALPGACYVNATTRQAVADEFETFLDMEASGWKGAAGTGSAIKLHPHLTAFYRDVATTMRGATDRCEIDSIYAEGRCLASQLCVVTGRECAALKIAYDQSRAELSPGHLLILRLVERCCADPDIELFDFFSDADWQHAWRPRVLARNRAFVALGRVPGRQIVTLFRIRFGPARRAVRWARAKRLEERFSALARTVRRDS